jgi:hypothetical protein
MQGGCACGNVRYQLQLPPLLVHCCHCTACQRQTGSAFATNAIVESSAVTLLPPASSSVAGSKTAPEVTPTGLMSAFKDLMLGSQAADKGATDSDASETDMIFVPSQSGVGTAIVQCPACRTGLWTHYVDGGPHITYLRVGTLDLPWEVQPDAHIYTRSRREFITLRDDKPQFEEYYQDREALYRENTAERVQRLKAKQGEWMTSLRASFS